MSIATFALKLLKEVVVLADKVKCNKKRCERLKKRLVSLQAPLEELQSSEALAANKRSVSVIPIIRKMKTGRRRRWWLRFGRFSR